jgi:hypothetical protein
MTKAMSLRNKIADIILTATQNYEMGASPSCGNVADAIMALFNTEETHKAMKGCIRCIRLGGLGLDDPFFQYQQGNISKGKLIEIIINRLEEYFIIGERYVDSYR